MAVFTPRPLQIPNLTTNYAAENQAFANLGQTLGSLPGDIRKERLQAQKEQLLGQIGTGALDYEKAGKSLIALGDTTAGAALLGLGQKQQERDLEKSWMGLGGTVPQSTGIGASVPSASSSGKMPPAEIKAIIDANVPEADREYAYRMAQKESSFDPSATSPTGAKGLFQFTGGTGRQYGLVDRAGDIRDNPTANTQAFARFTEDNRQALRQALGRDPTYGELALAHQQGAGGAIALLTGKGDINPNNLRVNNADPNADRGANAKRIMAYYGYGDGQSAAAPAQAPVQTAQAAIPGDDPTKLRSDAQYYAQSNPEAARQLNARADALEQSRGVQVAQAAPQAGQPVADFPASGAKEAQFVLPGTGEVIPQAISTDPAVRAAMGRYVTAPTERTRAVAKQALDLAVADAKQKQAINTPTDVQKNYEAARRQGYQGTLFDYQKELRSQTNVNVDTGQKLETAYASANGKAISDRFSKIVEEGDAANQEVGTLSRIRELGGQIKNIGSGAALQGWLAERGIKVGPNVSEIEAYSALIDKLTPQQRIAGAGATSDYDAKMFKNSLPGLMRTPGGNELILSTLEALNTYKRQRGDIVAEAMANNEKPPEVIKKLKELPDPFAGFKDAAKGGFKNVPEAPPSAPTAPAPPQRGEIRANTIDDVRGLPSGTIFIDPNGVKRRVP